MSNVSIKDIADRAGVSTMTVSRVLNRKTGQTRPEAIERAQRIRQIARDLGYRPNDIAQTMRTGRFNAISLILGAQEECPGWGWLPQSLMYGINQATHDAGLLLNMAAPSNEELTSDEHMPRALQQWCSDGLLVNYITHMPPKMAEVIDHYRIPTVYLNVKRKFDAVYPDDVDAAEQATQQLIALGHRRIVYLGPDAGSPDESHYSQADRIAGYRRAMVGAGLEAHCVDDTSCFHQRRVPANWAQVMAHRPTAVLVYNGTLALRAMNAARDAGLAVPHDLSIATFTDDWNGDCGGQPFSGMRLPFADIGRAAVQMLQQKIKQPEEHIPARALNARWELGETCAPCLEAGDG